MRPAPPAMTLLAWLDFGVIVLSWKKSMPSIGPLVGAERKPRVPPVILTGA